MWGENWLVSRFLVGAGHAYSNSKVMPYSEQFYIGGANSIRAFTVRSIGPGSYRPNTDNPNYYFDQTANFKLEANIEFRLKIYGGLQFALFLDAGNIWLLQDDPLRPGGKLEGKTFDWSNVKKMIEEAELRSEEDKKIIEDMIYSGKVYEKLKTFAKVSEAKG